MNLQLFYRSNFFLSPLSNSLSNNLAILNSLMYSKNEFHGNKKMKVKLEQSLKQSQTLNMTQEMRLGIELLQKNMLDLREFLIDELSQNPFLEVEDWGDDYSSGTDECSSDGDSSQDSMKEISEKSQTEAQKEVTDTLKTDNSYDNMSDIMAEYDWNSYKNNSGNSFGDTHVRKKNDYDVSSFSYENIVSENETLSKKLDLQVKATDLPDHIKDVMMYMVYSLDHMGFLRESDADIAEVLDVSIEDVTSSRSEMKKLDPVGITCRDLKDYLYFYFVESGNFSDDDEVEKAIIKFVSSEELLDLFVKKDYEKVYHKLRIDKALFLEMLSVFRKVSPFPSFGFDDFIPQTVVPDLKVHLINDAIVIEMENKFIPTITINSKMYDEQLDSTKKGEGKDFIKERYRAAEWIVKSLSERNKTLFEVASSIFNYQKAFLEFGENFLKPLTLKIVAEDIERHQSTVSRLTNGKFAVTPHGIYELKYFFVKKVNENVPTTNRHLETKIMEIIDNEPKKSPLSDEDIANLLSREGIDVARRTIAKYRSKLKIASARERKKNYEFSIGG